MENTVAKPDLLKFFGHLKKNSDPELLDFLRSIDKRASVKIVELVSYYLRRGPETVLFLERKGKGAEIKKALSETITCLQRTVAKYWALATIQTAGGSLLNAGAPLCPNGPMFFVHELESEIVRLSDVREKYEVLYSEKRLGVTNNHVWLVMLQEFVAAWSEFEFGKRYLLQRADLVALITAGKVALGWREDMSETDPELIGKAVHNFRSNPKNASLSGSVSQSRAQNLCWQVSMASVPSGIEI